VNKPRRGGGVDDAPSMSTLTGMGAALMSEFRDVVVLRTVHRLERTRTDLPDHERRLHEAEAWYVQRTWCCF
jgi:hypothetical protein